MEDCSLGPELKQILRKGDNRRQKHFDVFSVKERGDDLVGLAGDGMVVKDRGNRKRKKLGRKVEKFNCKMSESGVSPLKMRPKEC